MSSNPYTSLLGCIYACAREWVLVCVKRLCMSMCISVCISHIRSSHYAMYFIKIDVDGIVPVLQMKKLRSGDRK